MGNDITECFNQSIIHLKSLKNLKNLGLNLNTEEEVEFVIRNLMNLEILNENEVQREEILQGSAEHSRITHES